MSDLKSWNNAAGNNISASPNGWPEGMSPSGVNDSAREMMAAIRRWYESAEWVDLGLTPSYASTTSFTLVGNQITTFHANRRVRCSDTTTLYGTISSATYSANTRVSVSLDSGNLSASLSGVAVGILSFDNSSMPTVLNADTVDGYHASSFAPVTNRAIIRTKRTTQQSVSASTWVSVLFEEIEDSQNNYNPLTGIITGITGICLINVKVGLDSVYPGKYFEIELLNITDNKLMHDSWVTNFSTTDHDGMFLSFSGIFALISSKSYVIKVFHDNTVTQYLASDSSTGTAYTAMSLYQLT